MATTYQPIDNEDAFRAWLREHHQHKESLVRDGIARCRRINNALGNIREAYDADKCAKLLKQLTYTVEDAHNRQLPPEGLSFKGDTKLARYYDKTLLEGLRCLHNALKSYCEFRNGEHEKRGAVPNQPKSPKKCEARKMMSSDFETFLKCYHKWLIDEADLTKGSADCYKTYLRNLCATVDKVLGAGWFESLAPNYEKSLSAQDLNLCSAYIEINAKCAVGKDRKAWGDCRSAYHRFEEYLYDVTDSWNVEAKDAKQPRGSNDSGCLLAIPKCGKVAECFATASDKNSVVVESYTHDELCRRLLARLKTQGRYYPRHKLLFPTRLITKIFRKQKKNAWRIWLDKGIEATRILKSSNGDYVLLSDVKELVINNDGTVRITPKIGPAFDMMTHMAGGGIKKVFARQGFRSISIDHVKSLENVVGGKKGILSGLKELTELFKSFASQYDAKLDERAERVWVNDFFAQFKDALDTEAMRALLTADLQVLDLEYELMDIRENSKKGKGK